ncbi:DUF1636 family protein [Pontibaca salina]|uniref:DUF1636 domain-containing protein n=1 Tax=Pontibaca salina TaxID=2795731 RepID=A0A934LZK2_9RHOB|nr:DUF1636 domain-containing protein [Pontibaca salina]MBI6628768.1 DUF1636 domain-containing protein [Pontibaca salina]
MTETLDPLEPLQTELLVCVKCRKGQPTPDDGSPPGQRLFDRLTETPLPAGIHVRAVACLQNCDAGCNVALRGGDRWTYVYGGLDAAIHVETLADGVIRYHATTDGLIPWRERPEHFKRNCVARIPPINHADPNQKASQ